MHKRWPVDHVANLISMTKRERANISEKVRVGEPKIGGVMSSSEGGPLGLAPLRYRVEDH
jgi:hypothetical protein